MNQHLKFTPLDDGNVLIELCAGYFTRTMSMKADEIATCPFLPVLAGLAIHREKNEAQSATMTNMANELTERLAARDASKEVADGAK